MIKYLIYGHTGWIGGMVVDNILTTKIVKMVRLSSERLQNRESLLSEINEYKPTHVIVAAGLTGKPNVDWCEDHKSEVIETNVVGILNIVGICYDLDIHCTLFATGCIYEYPSNFDYSRVDDFSGYAETMIPNFIDSFYSYTKALVEDIITQAGFINNTLVLRVRMPISDSLDDPKNFITKLANYKKLINAPNSVSILSDLIPAAMTLTNNNVTGVYNFVNPGTVSHNDIMEYYKTYIDPSKTWINFTEKEQDLILKARRSNNKLDCSKLQNILEALGQARLPDVNDSLTILFNKWGAK